MPPKPNAKPAEPAAPPTAPKPTNIKSILRSIEASAPTAGSPQPGGKAAGMSPWQGSTGGKGSMGGAPTPAGGGHRRTPSEVARQEALQAALAIVTDTREALLDNVRAPPATH